VYLPVSAPIPPKRVAAHPGFSRLTRPSQCDAGFVLSAEIGMR
jgi:hypothetical protein